MRIFTAFTRVPRFAVHSRFVAPLVCTSARLRSHWIAVLDHVSFSRFAVTGSPHGSLDRLLRFAPLFYARTAVTHIPRLRSHIHCHTPLPRITHLDRYLTRTHTHLTPHGWIGSALLHSLQSPLCHLALASFHRALVFASFFAHGLSRISGWIADLFHRLR